MKRDELLNLKGGYDPTYLPYECYCYGAQDDTWIEYVSGPEELMFYLDQMCPYGGICDRCY